MHFFNSICRSFFPAAILLLCSCNPKIYKPYPHVAPLFQDKGEGQADLQIGSAGIGVSAAYAPAEHIALIANASIWDSKESASVNNNSYIKSPAQYNTCEFGGGYYTIFGNQGSFELLGGGGFGNREAIANNYDIKNIPSLLYVIRTGTANFFIQPGIGHISQTYEYGFSIKFNCVFYPNFHYQKNILGTTLYDSVATQWGPYAAIEPGFYIAKGNMKNNLKVFIQFGVSVPVTGNQVLFSDVVTSNGYISAGIMLRLRDWY